MTQRWNLELAQAAVLWLYWLCIVWHWLSPFPAVTGEPALTLLQTRVAFKQRTCHVRWADRQWQTKLNGQKGSDGGYVAILDDMRWIPNVETLGEPAFMLFKLKLPLYWPVALILSFCLWEPEQRRGKAGSSYLILTLVQVPESQSAPRFMKSFILKVLSLTCKQRTWSQNRVERFQIWVSLAPSLTQEALCHGR